MSYFEKILRYYSVQKDIVIFFINTFVEQMSQPNICEDANAKLIVEV